MLVQFSPIDLYSLHLTVMGSTHPTSSILFHPLRLGELQLDHRVVLGPCTRMRSTLESDGVYVPNEINAIYYAQRASKGGFMLTEATPISRYVSSSASTR